MLANVAIMCNNVRVTPHLCVAPQLVLELLLPYGHVGAGGGGGTSSSLRLILGHVHSSTFPPGSLQVYEIPASRGPFFLVNSGVSRAILESEPSTCHQSLLYKGEKRKRTKCSLLRKLHDSSIVNNVFFHLKEKWSWGHVVKL